MLTLQEFTKEAISFKDSLIGKPIHGAAKAGKEAIGKAFNFLRRNKPTKAEEKKAVLKLKDSLLGKAVVGSGKAVSGTASLASRLVTRKGKNGKRELDLVKSIMVGAPSYGAYRGATKGRAKMQKPKYYGPMKPESVYINPQRKLY